MFPTTIWTTIREAGAEDGQALEACAGRYPPPIHEYLRRRGFKGHDAEDVCHDVFVRIFSGGVLAKADAQRGRFRSLLLAVTTHVIKDRLRRNREVRVREVDPPQQEAEFDRSWARHLTERALEQLREQGSPYYGVLEAHLVGAAQDRNKLWIARNKLAALIRREVAFSCATHADYEAELAYLARFLSRPRKKG